MFRTTAQASTITTLTQQSTPRNTPSTENDLQSKVANIQDASAHGASINTTAVTADVELKNAPLTEGSALERIEAPTSVENAEHTTPPGYTSALLAATLGGASLLARNVGRITGNMANTSNRANNNRSNIALGAAVVSVAALSVAAVTAPNLRRAYRSEAKEAEPSRGVAPMPDQRLQNQTLQDQPAQQSDEAQNDATQDDLTASASAAATPRTVEQLSTAPTTNIENKSVDDLPQSLLNTNKNEKQSEKSSLPSQEASRFKSPALSITSSDINEGANLLLTREKTPSNLNSEADSTSGQLILASHHGSTINNANNVFETAKAKFAPIETITESIPESITVSQTLQPSISALSLKLDNESDYEILSTPKYGAAEYSTPTPELGKTENASLQDDWEMLNF